jgi:site-specific DNA-methyltransferase (adenine-specific)
MAAKGQKQLSRCHDIIFWYSKGKEWKFYVDEIRLPYAATSKARAGYKKTNLGGGTPASEICELNELGKFPEDWVQIPFIRGSEYLGYPTQKPEALLERIIKASSNKGDTILDAYCGCGTSIAVAERLERKWIGIDITYQSISLILKRLEESFPEGILDTVEINGAPRDFKSAVALAHKKEDKTRKEFEKWAVLTYSNNRAIINEKKGADAGIDGIAYMQDRDEKNDLEMKQVLFSVKSDKSPHVSYIRDFYGTIEREKAAMGYFITLNSPTRDMVAECKKLGKYKNHLIGTEYPKIEIITVEEILKGGRMSIPLSHQIAVVKSAQLKQSTKGQGKLF